MSADQQAVTTSKWFITAFEYGMMQAIGEGYELLSKSGYDIDYEGLSAVWNHGSIIESALIGYIQNAF